MATINKELADELLKGNGKSKYGTAGYCLVRYQNRTKYDIPGVDLYNPDAEVNCFDYAIFPNKRKYEEFMVSETVGGVEILWASKKCKKDEVLREQSEEQAELSEGLADFLPDFEEEAVLKPGKRER